MLSGSGPTFHSLVRGISMTPSMMACATCTPLGPNSRPSDCPSARRANLPVANDAHPTEPLSAAVAPVKISVGGCGRCVDLRRRGSVAWEKR